MVIASDPLVVADAGTLPEEADERVALVVAGQPAVVLEALAPALEKLRGGLVLRRRQHSGRGVAQAAQQRHEVAHRDAASAIDGDDPLAVVDDEAVLAGLEGLGELLEGTGVVAQEEAQHRLVVALAQARVEPRIGLGRNAADALAVGAQPRRGLWQAGASVSGWEA